MQKDYLVIDLENSREEFADSWNIIKGIRTNTLDQMNNCKGIRYFDASNITGGEGKLINDINNEYYKMQYASREQMDKNCGICLWIKDNSENDIIEYQYLALILQNTEEVICYIYPDIENRIYKLYNELSCYFSFFIQRHNREKRIWVCSRRGEEKYIETLETRLSNNSYKVTPIIEYEYQEWEEGKQGRSVLESWTRTVRQLLYDCTESQEICNIEPYQEISYRLSNARTNQKKEEDKIEKSIGTSNANIERLRKIEERIDRYSKEISEWQRKRNRLDDISRKSEDGRLLCRCRNYFVMNPKSRNTEEMNQYKALLKNREIQKILGNTSILAFYILCMQVHFTKNEIDLDAEKIVLLLINAEELAEGIFQLLENLHHSSEKRGLFSIRIHEKKEENSYLSSIYPDYGLRDSDSAAYSFEFRILDCSRNNIIKSFKKKMGKQLPKDFGVEKFFEYKEDAFWKEYNKVPENLVHHYGLQIFSTIISNNGGRFRVVSSSKLIPNIKKPRLFTAQP